MGIDKQLEAFATLISVAATAAPLTLAILFLGVVCVILAYKKR